MILPFFNMSKSLEEVSSSKLFDEMGFYKAFVSDLLRCKEEAIIESPFVSTSRMEFLRPVFTKLIKKGVKIHIFTRDPIEHDESNRHFATNEILSYKEMGVNIILLNGHHHRKLAILDQSILWEGSLNILSHCRSMEIMRRIEGRKTAREMMDFLSLKRVI